MQNLRDKNIAVVKKLKHINENALATSQTLVEQIDASLRENKTTQVRNKEKVKITSKNNQLTEQKNRAKQLRLENEKLSNEYQRLYIMAKKNPNDKKLQNQLAQKDKELRANALAFITLRSEIQKTDPLYKAFVDGPVTLKKRIDNETQPIAIVQLKKPILTTHKVKENPMELAGNKVEVAKPIYVTNSNVDKNKDKLVKLKAKDKELKKAIKAIKGQKSQLTKKERKLQDAQNRFSGMQKYTYSNKSSSSISYDSRKMRYLQQANEIRNRNQGKPFSKWSKSDKVSMGIIARNLGIASSSSITHKGAILNALFQRNGLYGMKNRYAKITTTSSQTIRNTHYAYTDLESTINALNREISDIKNNLSTKENIIRGLEIQKNNLMSSVEDSVQNYNNDVKVQVADTAPQTVQRSTLVQKDWRGNFTFAAEKHDGTTVYTGGDWGTTAEYLQYGASDLFSFDSNNPDRVNGGYFEHGTNTATDNTKQFDVVASGANTNIKSLDISQSVGNGNTRSFKEAGNYTYTVWGEWAQTGGLKTDINNATGLDLAAPHNNWIVGEVTKDLPQQGSATYSGRVDGYTSWSSNNIKIHTR